MTLAELSTFLAERDKALTCGALGYVAEPKSPANQFRKAPVEKLYVYKKTNHDADFKTHCLHYMDLANQILYTC